MKKLLRMLLIALFLLSLTLSSTAFAGGGGDEEVAPSPPILFYWEFDRCGAHARTYSVFAVNQAVASVHDLGLITANDGVIPSIYDGWPGGKHTNPYTVTVDSQILDSRFSWHWGYGGGADHYVYTGAPRPCVPIACREIDRVYKVEELADGTIYNTVDWYYVGNCDRSKVDIKNDGWYMAPGGLWLDKDPNTGLDRDYIWVWRNGMKVKFSKSLAPTACGKYNIEIRSDTLVGGRKPYSPPKKSCVN